MTPAESRELATNIEALVTRISTRASPTDRYLLGIAGSPGSGKTTLAIAVTAGLNDAVPESAAYVPMDGFHLANATLDRLGIHDRKGAIDTFDGWGYLALLDRLRTETEHTVYAPSFRREVDEGVTGEIAVEPTVRFVITEGNYLLVDQQPWSLVRQRLDDAWFCATDEAVRHARLVERHVRHGRTVEAATAWAIEVDGTNAVGIEASRPRADLVVSGETAAVLR